MTKQLLKRTVNFFKMATGFQVPDSNEDDNLTYDWDECETLQIVRAFPISDYGTKSDQSSIEYPLVPEPPSVSGIIDSTISIPPTRTISDVEENYVEDDVSSLTSISNIKISNAPRKHRFAKERVEREGNIYDKLYNACLTGELSTIKDVLENHNTTLLPDENGQTPLYAACVGNHTEIVKRLIDFGYDVDHQDNEGRTPLHTVFENHTPDLAQILITQFKANTEIRDKQNWTPLHTAIDRGYSGYSQELLEKFLHKDAGTKVSWIQLHAAVYEENTQAVQFILGANTDVNHVSSAGYAALHIAVTKSNIDIVTLLLDQDVNVHSVTIDGKTPLHIAVDKGKETIVQKLLTQKADPNLKDATGNTCLHLAVQVKEGAKPCMQKGAGNSGTFTASYKKCSIQTVQAIVHHGGDVNAVNNKGQTPLWFACCDGQGDLVKILLEIGTDPNSTDRDGDSCLHAAIYGCCSFQTIQEIVDCGAHVNSVNKEGATPLLLACSTAQTELVKILLKAKADPNIAYADGEASLHAAVAAYCSKETIQEIIDCGADVNAVNKRGRTALLLGCFYRQMDSVKVLLGAGADPAIADEEGFSCVHAAIDGRCSKDILQALIIHGAQISAKRKDGTNALLRACTTGQSESVQFLLEAGADVNIASPNGNTCLHEAVYGYCSGKTLQAIIQYGLNANTLSKTSKTALIVACYKTQAESVKFLLQNGADPNISDANGYTSLHAAVHGRCTNETLQEIIAHGVYVNAQDTGGATALWLACSYRQYDSAKILLEAGSNPNIATTNRNTSLHAAVSGQVYCSKNLIQTLIDHGVDVNATNKNNTTALMLVCEKGIKGAINILLNAGANPNIADVDGNSVIHQAVRFCSKEILQAVIRHGADVNAANMKNVTALMMAYHNGNIDAISVLLDSASDPDIIIDGKTRTLLHYAVEEGCSVEVLLAIFNHSADVNAVNKNNVTALMIAFEKGNEGAINALLNAGADLNITDVEGNSGVHHAVILNCNSKILQAVINQNVNVNATNMKNETALMIACQKGNESAIHILMNAGADPNIVDVDGNSGVHHAVIEDCNSEMLQSLINQCQLVNVNATNMNNETALMIACERGNEGAINILLNAGADPNIADVYGNSGIHHVVLQCCGEEIVQAIINHGANVDATNRNNVTALMKACQTGNVDAVKVLLRSGADPNITDTDGNTWLHFAVDVICKTEVLQTIIDHVDDVNATNIYNTTALMKACFRNDMNAINVLLNAGADPAITDIHGCTWIHYAVAGNYKREVLQAIIDHGADVNARNEYNQTALMISCQRENAGAVNVLLNAGADIRIANTRLESNVYCRTNPTLLSTIHPVSIIDHDAGDCEIKILQDIIGHGDHVYATGCCTIGRLEFLENAHKYNHRELLRSCQNRNADAIIIDIVLNIGSNPDIGDNDQNSLIHYAVNKGCSEKVLQVIIDHGADVNAINKKNRTALMIACEKGNGCAINVLLNAGADPNIADADGCTCLHDAVDWCSNEVFQAVIDHGGDVNALNKKNRTVLMRACMRGNTDAINTLLNAGADPSIVDDDGYTWLHYAVGYCSNEVIKAIIDRNADVNFTNKQNKTALMIACERANGGAINVLLNAGADPNIAYADGCTCLHVVVKRHYSKEVIQTIIDHGANVNALYIENRTKSMKAGKVRNAYALNVRLNAPVDCNLSDIHRYRCTHDAFGGNCSKEVKSSNKNSLTALLKACQMDYVDAINILLNAKADPRIADVDDNTCLHYAVREGCSKVVLQAIINHGADVNATNKHHETALKWACETKNVCAINVLLNAGADPSIVDSNGDTCLHTAVLEGCSKDALQAIIEHDADVNSINKNNKTVLMIACRRRNIDAIDVLLNAGADHRMADADGSTCLHHAVYGDCSQMALKNKGECTKVALRAIILHGTDLNATNKRNRTALMIACMTHNADAIVVLLKAGADPNIVHAGDDPCLHNVVRLGCSRYVLQAMINHGADVNATNKYHKTALMTAHEKGNPDAMNILLDAGAGPNIADTNGNKLKRGASSSLTNTEIKLTKLNPL